MLPLAASSTIKTIAGPAANAFCGTSVAALGDVNGDEIADFAIGCPGEDSTALGALLPTTGKVYVIFGRPDPQNIDLACIRANQVLSA